MINNAPKYLSLIQCRKLVIFQFDIILWKYWFSKWCHTLTHLPAGGGSWLCGS